MKKHLIAATAFWVVGAATTSAAEPMSAASPKSLTVVRPNAAAVDVIPQTVTMGGVYYRKLAKPKSINVDSGALISILTVKLPAGKWLVQATASEYPDEDNNMNYAACALAQSTTALVSEIGTIGLSTGTTETATLIADLSMDAKVIQTTAGTVVGLYCGIVDTLHAGAKGLPSVQGATLSATLVPAFY